MAEVEVFIFLRLCSIDKQHENDAGGADDAPNYDPIVFFHRPTAAASTTNVAAAAATVSAAEAAAAAAKPSFVVHNDTVGDECVRLADLQVVNADELRVGISRDNFLRFDAVAAPDPHGVADAGFGGWEEFATRK